MADPTLSDLMASVSALLGKRDLTLQQFQNWLAGAAGGGAGGDGKFPLTDSTGFVRNLPSPAQLQADTTVLGPLHFGAIGDGQSHPASTVFATLAACQAVYPFATSLAQEMDWLAHQKMVNIYGGQFLSDRRTYKMCNPSPDSQQPLVWIANVCSYDAGDSVFDYSDMRVKVNTTHIIPDYDFSTAGIWANQTGYASYQILQATFDQGYANCFDSIDGTGDPRQTNPYFEFFQNITIPPGRWRLLFKGELVQGQSYDHGNVNPPYTQIAIEGGGFTKSVTLSPQVDTANPRTTWAPFSGQFDFQTTTSINTAIRIRAGGWASWRFHEFDLIPWPADCAILHTRDNMPHYQHYFDPQRFKRGKLQGPGTTSGVTGAVWKSFQDFDGDLQEWEQVESINFSVGIEWSDGAYLLNYWSCRLDGNDVGALFQAGAFNAGENMRFYGGTLSGNRICFLNPGGAEITVFGSPPDYGGALCSQNTGTIRMIGLRQEQNRIAGLPIWHCQGQGKVIYTASFILVAGSVATADTAPALLEGPVSSLEFHHTYVYNASSDPAGAGRGLLAIGDGRVVFDNHPNSGRPNLGPLLISDSPISDIYGGAGLFEPVTTFPSGVSLDPSGIFLEGGVFGRGVVDRWTSQDLAVDISSARFRSGTQSMRVRKLTPYDNQIGVELHLLTPLKGIGNILGLNYIFTEPFTYSSPTAPIYYRQFWVQVIGHDALGRPIYGGQSAFKGEADINAPTGGMSTWLPRTYDTSFSDFTSADNHGDRSPIWATHLLTLYNLQSIPALTFYIDDMRANFIG